MIGKKVETTEHSCGLYVISGLDLESFTDSSNPRHLEHEYLREYTADVESDLFGY